MIPDEGIDRVIPQQLAAVPAPRTVGEYDLQGLIAAVPIAIVVYDMQGTIRLWSAAARSLFGWDEEEVLGRPAPFIPDGLQPECISCLEAALAGRTTIIESRRHRRDGSLVDVCLTTTPIRDGDGAIRRLLVTYEDLTERRRTRAIEAGLHHVLELLSTDAPLDDLLAELVRSMEAQSADGMLGSILLLDASGTHLVHGAAPSLPAAYNEAIEGLAIGPEVGSCGTAAHFGQPVHVEDIRTDPRWSDLSALAEANGLRACWSTPIFSSTGKVLGTFAMYYPQPRAPGEADLALVDVATRTAMLAIERRRAEEAVHRRSRQFQTLLDQAPMGMYLVDGDLRLLQINPAALKSLGDVGDVVGRNFVDVVNALWPGPLAVEVIARFRHTLATGESFVVPEFADRRPSLGATAYYHWQISRITLPEGGHGVVCYFKDISDIVRGRRALAKVSEDAERRRRFFDTVLSHTPDLVYVFDLKHRFTYANNALLAMCGKRLEDAVGKTCLELGYEPWHAAMHEREIDQVAATRRPIRGEVPFEGTNGRRIHDYIFVPILGADGQVEAVAGTTRDVTERKQAETALHALAAELSDADRRKDEFIALLAHELRNPLAPISNALQIMRLADGRKESMDFAAAVMERQLSQLVRLVDDLLDVSRISRGKIDLRLERLQLASAVTHAVEAVRPLARSRDQRLLVSLPPEPLELRADPIRLAQIIGNLLNNAVKFTEHGGSIHLRIERDGDQAVLRVTDNGIGIEPDHIPRIFEMFTQLDTSLERSVSGLGIGLSLVRSLVEMHGGSVSVFSGGRGQGAEFTVRLPLLVEPETQTRITGIG
jgi:PAS domain S-box-containing protein